MTNTVSARITDEDLRAQIQALQLPSKPLIMTRTLGEKRRICGDPNHVGKPCCCFEQLTFLVSDWPGPVRPDSPEPELAVKKPVAAVVNGANAKKKLTLGQYSAGKKSSGASPAGGEKGVVKTPVTVGKEERKEEKKMEKFVEKEKTLPPPPRSAQSQPNTQTQTQKPATPPVSNQNNARSPVKTAKPVAGSKRPPESRPPLASDHSSAGTNNNSNSNSNMRRTVSTDSVRPAKRQRTPTPPPPRSRISVQRPTPPPKSPELRLPPLLSPTLPKSIEDALAAEDRAKYEKSTTRATSSSSTRPRSTSNVSAKPLKPLPSGKKPPGLSSGTSPQPGSPVKLKSKTTQKAVKRPASPAPLLSPRNPKRQTGSVVVKLAFKKRLRDFQSLIKLDANSRRKREIKEEDSGGSRALKRQKVPGNVNTTKTTAAKSPAVQSPALRHKESRDRHLQTPPPKKMNGLTVKRGDDALTPSNVHVTPSAGSMERDRDRDRDRERDHERDRDTDRDREPYRAKTPEAETFHQEYKRLIKIGRSAKHEAQKDFDHPNLSIRRKSIFNLVDSCLLFFTAFIVWDRMQHLDRHSSRPDHWRTLLDLTNLAAEKCRQSKELSLMGLIKHVEAVARQHIFNQELDRFSKMPLPATPSTPSKAPTPDAHAPPLPPPQQFARYRALLYQDHREMRTAWAEGMRLLPFDVLMEEFPETWKTRGREGENVDWREWPREVARYEAAYALPLGVNTAPPEAANFAVRMLGEWAASKGVRGRSRLAEMMAVV